MSVNMPLHQIRFQFDKCEHEHNRDLRTAPCEGAQNHHTRIETSYREIK